MMRNLLLALLALLLALPLGAAATEEELLAPEEAFQIDIKVQDDNTVAVGWKIAEGYFLYKHAFKFSTGTDGFQLSEAVIPKGKVKQDEWFGEVETYRKAVNITVPVTRQAGVTDLELKTVVQGCADVGVCYPPFTQKTVLKFPAGGSGASTAGTGGASAIKTANDNPLADLNMLAANLGGDNEFLPVDEAFGFDVWIEDNNTMVANWTVADEYYLYRDKIAFSLENSEGVTLGDVVLPSGKTKEDEFFGRVQIYETDRAVDIPFVRNAAANDNITLVAKYQGCAVAGICYPPVTKKVALKLPPSGGASSTVAFENESTSSGSGGTTEVARASAAVAVAASTAAKPFVSEQDRIAGTLGSGSAWLTILTFFGLGLLLAFTPCVFPMIPILSGIIAGQGDKISTRKAFMLSLVYVLAMASTYTIAGVFVGMSGENVQAMFQNPWVLSVFAGVFVLLSLAMFGFYELQMPSAVQNRLTSISNSQEGGTYVGAGIMGLLSALIVGPCVTAPLVGALIYIAQTGDAVLGGTALFALSMGMGAPLIVIGTSAGKLMPKAGPWMDAIKAVFGVMLLGVAIWMLERILPVAIIMMLSGALLIISGIYLGAFEAVKEAVSGWFRLWKGLGQVVFVYGVLLVVGAASGGHSLLQPLKGVLVAGNGAGGGEQQLHAGLQFQPVKGLDGLQKALETASAQGKTVMLDFYADWCISCKEMEAYTFTDEAVQVALKDTVLIQADVTDNDDQDKALLKSLGLFGPPAILFYDNTRQEQRPYRVVGFMPADDFSNHVGLVFSPQAASL